jgi:hypothetical protein
MSELKDRESIKTAQAKQVGNAHTERRFEVHHEVPHLHRLVSGRLLGSQSRDRQSTHGLRRVLVLLGL